MYIGRNGKITVINNSPPPDLQHISNFLYLLVFNSINYDYVGKYPSIFFGQITYEFRKFVFRWNTFRNCIALQNPYAQNVDLYNLNWLFWRGGGWIQNNLIWPQIQYHSPRASTVDIDEWMHSVMRTRNVSGLNFPKTSNPLVEHMPIACLTLFFSTGWIFLFHNLTPFSETVFFFFDKRLINPLLYLLFRDIRRNYTGCLMWAWRGIPWQRNPTEIDQTFQYFVGNR